MSYARHNFLVWHTIPLDQVPFYLSLLARWILHWVTCYIEVLRFQTWPSFDLIIIIDHVYIANISLLGELWDPSDDLNSMTISRQLLLTGFSIQRACYDWGFFSVLSFVLTLKHCSMVLSYTYHNRCFLISIMISVQLCFWQEFGCQFSLSKRSQHIWMCGWIHCFSLWYL